MNPQDILLWSKASAKRAKPDDAAVVDLLDPKSALKPEQLDQAKIEDLISKHLQQDLQVLAPAELSEALHK